MPVLQWSGAEGMFGWRPGWPWGNVTPWETAVLAGLCVCAGIEQEPRKHVAPAVAEPHAAKSPWRPLVWVQ